VNGNKCSKIVSLIDSYKTNNKTATEIYDVGLHSGTQINVNMNVRKRHTDKVYSSKKSSVYTVSHTKSSGN